MFLFLVSVVRKKKRNQKKKDRWCKLFTLQRTKSAKNNGRLFLNFVKRNLKTVGFVLVQFAEILSLFFPLNQPNTAADFLNEPKGYIQIAGMLFVGGYRTEVRYPERPEKNHHKLCNKIKKNVEKVRFIFLDKIFLLCYNIFAKLTK